MSKEIQNKEAKAFYHANVHHSPLLIGLSAVSVCMAAILGVFMKGVSEHFNSQPLQLLWDVSFVSPLFTLGVISLGFLGLGTASYFKPQKKKLETGPRL